VLSHLLVFAAGVLALVVGAEALVRGASRLALSFGVPPLVVGLTVVAFGTSAPELAVSVGAALDGNPDLAIGNVVGSNIANILVILGASALVAPIAVALQVIRQEVPVMIGASALLVALAANGVVGRAEAALLLFFAAAYTVFLVRQARQAPAAPRAESITAPDAAGRRWDGRSSVQLLLIGAGLGLLALGGDRVVDAAVAIARLLGLSDLVIGLTVVAVGTSMPELATSVLAGLRGARDIAVGNVIGSNVLNILAVLGATGLVAPAGLPVPEAALRFDLWVMLAAAVVCLPIFLAGGRIARWEGALLLGYYFAYATYLVMSAQQHAALPTFSFAMKAFVIPLTVVTLAVSQRRSQRRDATTAPN
jgi:cation:H+ antiporter